MFIHVYLIEDAFRLCGIGGAETKPHGSVVAAVWVWGGVACLG